jgi:NTP pyrophosphatase (non-canonical NTP hydrolase)
MKNLRQMQNEAHENAKSKGWWDGIEKKDLTVIPEKLCLIHSEVSEALEDYRDGKLEESMLENGKPVGFPSELADVVIRIFDLCGHLEIDLEGAILRKMAFNATRPHRHGGKAC